MNKSFKSALLISLVVISLGFCTSKDTKANPEGTSDNSTNSDSNTAGAGSGAEGTGSDKTGAEGTGSSKDSSTVGDLASRGLNAANEGLLTKLNETLNNLRYPDGKSVQGFAYKKWEIPNKKDFVNWVKSGGSALKKGIDELPASVALEISGHTDTTGPEEAVGDKKGNNFYSDKRAKEVKQTLVKLGLPEARIVTKALGATQPLADVDGASSLNRRVTFKFITVEAPAEPAKTEDGSK